MDKNELLYKLSMQHRLETNKDTKKLLLEAFSYIKNVPDFDAITVCKMVPNYEIELMGKETSTNLVKHDLARAIADDLLAREVIVFKKKDYRNQAKLFSASIKIIVDQKDNSLEKIMDEIGIGTW